MELSLSTLLWLIVIAYIVFRLVTLRRLSRRMDALTVSVEALQRHLGFIAPVSAAPTDDPLATPLQPPLKSDAPPFFQKTLPALDMEKLFGGRVFIWLGGIALALGAMFLVQYSIEQGMLAPPLRVGLGAAFGGLLIGIAWRLNPRYALIREVLAGAGILALYAALFAGATIYKFWTPALALLMMAGVTTLSIGIAASVGRRIAYIGLIGGYAAPLMVGAEAPHALALFGYLMLLGLALGEIGLRRAWPALAVWGACGGALWLLFYTAVHYTPADLVVLCIFILASTLWQIAVAARLQETEIRTRYRYINIILIAALLAMLLLAVRAHYDVAAIITAFLLLAGCVLFQRMRNAGRISLLITSLGAIFFMLYWPSEIGLQAYAFFGFGIMVLYGLVSWSALPAWPWALASSGVALAGFLIAYAKWSGFNVEILPNYMMTTIIYSPTAWAGLALLMAAYFTGAVMLTLRRFGNWWQAEEAVSFFAASAVAFIALAFAIRFNNEPLAAAWTAEIAGLLLLSARFTLPALRTCAVVLSGVLMLYLLGGLLVEAPLGDGNLGRIFLSYALPAGVFAFAAARLPSRRPFWHRAFFDMAAPLAGLLWFYISARTSVQALYPADPANAAWINGLLITATLAMGAVCVRVGDLRGRPTLRFSGKLMAYAALAGLGLTYVTFANPLISGAAVGSAPFINALLFIYAFPALLAAILARDLARTRDGSGRFYIYGYALLLLFLYTICTVRQLFHGTHIDQTGMESMELYLHSLALIAVAFALLTIGIIADSRTLRVGSLVYMAIGALKVFLWDMGDLAGLWRVVAFIGLGASLVGIGYIYQRFGLLFERGKIAPKTAL